MLSEETKVTLKTEAVEKISIIGHLGTDKCV